MKRNVSRLLLLGLFVLSVAAAGAVFADAAIPTPLAACPQCNTLDLTCVGSPCDCKYDGPPSTKYYCAPPSL
jgi:hypothetical protein